MNVICQVGGSVERKTDPIDLEDIDKSLLVCLRNRKGAVFHHNVITLYTALRDKNEHPCTREPLTQPALESITNHYMSLGKYVDGDGQLKYHPMRPGESYQFDKAFSLHHKLNGRDEEEDYYYEDRWAAFIQSLRIKTRAIFQNSSVHPIRRKMYMDIEKAYEKTLEALESTEGAIFVTLDESKPRESVLGLARNLGLDDLLIGCLDLTAMMLAAYERL